MFELKLWYYIFVVLFYLVGLVLIVNPAKIMTIAMEASKNKPFIFYAGVLNSMIATAILYTAFFFHPVMLVSEWILAVVGIIIGLKGLFLVFATDNLTKKIYPKYLAWFEGKVPAFGIVYLILAGLGTYVITTL